MVNCGRLKWYGHVEHKNIKSDWVSTCRKLQVEGPNDKRKGSKVHISRLSRRGTSV